MRLRVSTLTFAAANAATVSLLSTLLGCSSSDSAPPTGLPPDTGTNSAEGVTSGATLLAAEAGREMAAAKSSYYSHDVNVVEATGTFDYDCSGFIDYALIRVLPAHYRELVAETSSRPRAQDYVSFFTKPPSDWQVITNVSTLQPGDILAWLAAADDNGDTGHIMIVRSAPRVDASRAGAFDIDIWDSTDDVHGDTDSRKPSNSTGIGSATVVVYADANGVPTQHAWSEISSSTDTTQVAMGRAL